MTLLFSIFFQIRLCATFMQNCLLNSTTYTNSYLLVLSIKKIPIEGRMTWDLRFRKTVRQSCDRLVQPVQKIFQTSKTRQKLTNLFGHLLPVKGRGFQ